MTTNPDVPVASPPNGRATLLRIAPIVMTVLSVLVTILGIAMLGLPRYEFWDGEVSGNYWLMSQSFFLNQIFPWVFLLALLWLSMALLKSLGLMRGIVEVIVTVVVVGVLFIAWLTFLGPGLSEGQHVGSVQAGDTIYHLASRRDWVGSRTVPCDPTPPPGVDRFGCGESIFEWRSVLFECDALGIECKRVFLGEGRREDYATSIRFNAAQGVIELVAADGRVVERYTP